MCIVTGLQVREEADEETRLNIASQSRDAGDAFQLPTAQELAEERAGPPNLPRVARRIKDVVAVLADFRK